MRIILASASPRRQVLLKELFHEFEIIPSDIPECSDRILPSEIAEDLSRQKARFVYEKTGCSADAVIGADTIVVVRAKEPHIPEFANQIIPKEGTTAVKPDCLQANNAESYPADAVSPATGKQQTANPDKNCCTGYGILGKPKDETDAVRMLKMLCGNTHEVYTGVTVITGNKTVTGSEKTSVTIGAISDNILYNYIKTGSSMDKAGAYGLQDIENFAKTHIAGNRDNVVGLPVTLLRRLLAECGIAPDIT